MGVRITSWSGPSWDFQVLLSVNLMGTLSAKLRSHSHTPTNTPTSNPTLPTTTTCSSRSSVRSWTQLDLGHCRTNLEGSSDLRLFCYSSGSSTPDYFCIVPCVCVIVSGNLCGATAPSDWPGSLNTTRPTHHNFISLQLSENTRSVKITLGFLPLNYWEEALYEYNYPYSPEYITVGHDNFNKQMK